MAKRTPTPDELDEIRALLAELRRDLRELIELVQTRLEQRPA
jgi:hypothetical protein